MRLLHSVMLAGLLLSGPAWGKHWHEDEDHWNRHWQHNHDADDDDRDTITIATAATSSHMMYV